MSETLESITQTQNKAKVYKLCILYDGNYVWTYSSVGPFLNSEPLYITIKNDSDIMHIMSIIADIIIERVSKHYEFKDDVCRFRYTDDNRLDEEDENEVQINTNDREKINDFLIEHKDLAILQISTGDYWCRIYISLRDLSYEKIKGCEYTDDEIIDYIGNKFIID